MKLADFMTMHRLTGPVFAEKIGVTRQALDRYLKGRIPEPETMRRIIAETAGEVTPNDFFRDRFGEAPSASGDAALEETERAS